MSKSCLLLCIGAAFLCQAQAQDAGLPLPETSRTRTWTQELKPLDSALRARHGLGVQVLEHNAARLGIRPSSPGQVTVTTGLLAQIDAQARAEASSPQARSSLRQAKLAELLEKFSARKLGTTPNTQALLTRTRAIATAQQNSAGLFDKYRRSDKTLDWKRMRRDAAHGSFAGLVRFNLALFLTEFGHALATRDPARLEEFFEGATTTDFYLKHGLFVFAGVATEAATSAAYTKYLQPYLKRGFLHGVLKSQLSLAAVTALPQLADGSFSGERFVISLGSLGLSAAAVQGSLGRIPWLQKVASGKGLGRMGGFAYKVAELTIVLTVGSELDGWANRALSRREAKKKLVAAAEAVTLELQQSTTQEERTAALRRYSLAWDEYRLFLYAPLLAVQEELQHALEPVVAQSMENDVAAAEAQKRVERFERLGADLAAYAADRRGRLDLPRMESLMEAFNRDFAEQLAAVYEAGRRERSLFTVDPSLLSSAEFAQAHGDVSANRLQTYEDQQAAYRALESRLAPEASAELSAARSRVAELAQDDERFLGEQSQLRRGLTDSIRGGE